MAVGNWLAIHIEDHLAAHDCRCNIRVAEQRVEANIAARFVRQQVWLGIAAAVARLNRHGFGRLSGGRERNGSARDQRRRQ